MSTASPRAARRRQAQARRRIVWGALAGAVVLVALVGTVVSSLIPTAQPDFYGVNAQYVFEGSRAEVAQATESMARTGVGVVRKDAFWSDAEPEPPRGGRRTFDWRDNDEIARALAERRLSWLALLGYGTSWATSSAGPDAWMSPPDDPELFAGYAAAFAARYGRDGSFWTEHRDLPYTPVEDYEIWNEPDITFGPEETAAARYATLFRVTAQAIREVDPEADIVVGGLSSKNATSFVVGMYQHDPQVFDDASAVAFHPYGKDPSQTVDRIRDLRATLRAVGGSQLGIEVTETGWAVPPFREVDRARWTRELAAALPTSDCHVTRFVLHTWTSREQDVGDTEHWFGIADAEGVWRPTAVALRDGIHDARSGERGALEVSC